MYTNGKLKYNKKKYTIFISVIYIKNFLKLIEEGIYEKSLKTMNDVVQKITHEYLLCFLNRLPFVQDSLFSITFRISDG